MKRIIPLVLIVSVLAVGFLSSFFPPARASEEPITVDMEAYQFGFSPERIYVRVGQPVTFRVTSRDVTHGFYIDGKDIKVDVPLGEITTVGPVTFDDAGKFKIRCATLCGPLHPFMVAEVIVEPAFALNSFHIFSLLVVALAVGMLIYLWKYEPDNTLLGVPIDREIDLLKVRGIGSPLKRLLQWRGIHYTLILPNLFIFMIIIVTGLFGNPLGALNFSIAVVWILWFAAVEFMIFFAGRTWCTLCPLPAVGEWIARRRLYSVAEPKRWFSLNRRWPSKLNNMWVPTLGFLGISLIIPWLVTRPVVTGLFFLLLIVMGLIIPLVFMGSQRNFCRHICPASGYIGHSASASIFAVRHRDKRVCDTHTAKECIKGSPKGYGCPWKLYPGGNISDVNCGQCYECLKSCPLDNMTVKLRMIGKEGIERGEERPDEAWMGFIRFSLVIIYQLVFFGGFFWIKDWGNMGVQFGANLPTIGLLVPTPSGFANWLMWAALIAGMALVVFPAIFYAFSWLAKKAAKVREVTTKKTFLTLSYALVPYQLLLWMSFGLSLILINWAYHIYAFSDPMGQGWNVLGLTSASKMWSPIAAGLLPFIQSAFLFAGLALAIGVTHKLALKLFGDRGKAMRATTVMSTLHTLSGIAFLWVLLG
jgi:plastocyanin/ferredoxin